MLRRSIILATLVCTNIAWGSQVTTDLSNEYINKVTNHLDGMSAQIEKIETAETDAKNAQSVVSSAEKSVAAVQKDLKDADYNTDAYPRRIRRDNASIIAKREESKNIFRNTFPDFNSPDEAIRSVKSAQNRLKEDKAILEGRLERRRREFDAPIARAKVRVEENRRKLAANQEKLSQTDAEISASREDLRKARKEFQTAKKLKDDPRLQQKIEQARKSFREADEARKKAGTRCNGLRGIKRVCRRYREARANLQRLQNIAKPGSLRPLQQKLERAEKKLADLMRKKRTLRSETDSLEDQVRRSRGRIADLEEERRRATSPVRGEIADINGQLERLDVRLDKANKLESLENEIRSLERRIKRNEERLIALPALIEKLQDDLAVVAQELEHAQERSADLQEALAEEQAVLINQRQEINELKADMNASLVEVTELLPATEPVSNIDNLIYPSGDWSVLTTDLDHDWKRASCRAETLEIIEEADSEEISSAKLKVVNLVNPTNGFNEPVVVMTVDTKRDDFTNLNVVTIRVNSSTTYTLDLIYSKSSKNKLFYMADLADREGLIDMILKKSRMEVKISSENINLPEEITFSLKGSTNALNSRSSRAESMRNACGGIKINDI